MSDHSEEAAALGQLCMRCETVLAQHKRRIQMVPGVNKCIWTCDECFPHLIEMVPEFRKRYARYANR